MLLHSLLLDNEVLSYQPDTIELQVFPTTPAIYADPKRTYLADIIHLQISSKSPTFS